MATTGTFSQFRAGGEHKGRTATLKAVAYCTGQRQTDERNNHHFDYAGQGRGERILRAGMFLPSDSPAHFNRHHFKTLGAFQQAVWTSLARHEEKQRRQHAGRTGHGKPIISRHDVLLLDKRIFLDGNGKMRPDGIDHAYQVVRDFLRENYTRKGLVASFAIHDQDDIAGTGNGNFHVHIISSYRTLTADGWGERVRPFGKSAWATWAKQKQSSLFKIQTRKLEQLGVIPKVERIAGKRETLTAWKAARGISTGTTFRPPQNFSDKHFVPAPNWRAMRAPVIPLVGMASGKYEALTHREIRLSDNAARDTEPQDASGGGGSGTGGGELGGGELGGGDAWLAGLYAAVATASEKLATAMRTGIGIPAAQADLAAAKYNLAQGKGSGKGKAQGGGAARPKSKRRHHRMSDQKLL